MIFLDSPKMYLLNKISNFFSLSVTLKILSLLFTSLFLAEAGANFSVANKKKQTPFDIAIKKAKETGSDIRFDVVKYLKSVLPPLNSKTSDLKDVNTIESHFLTKKLYNRNNYKNRYRQH